MDVHPTKNGIVGIDPYPNHQPLAPRAAAAAAARRFASGASARGRAAGVGAGGTGAASGASASSDSAYGRDSLETWTELTNSIVLSTV